MNPPPDRVAQLFAEALACPTPEERERFLDKTCAGDAALRQRVSELLRAHDSVGAFMAGTPATGLPASRATERIGRYKLLQQLGEGGCGVVWMAEQEEPVRRRVALKIIKLGMDTREVIARFEAERQALALMDHPNIARVLDAGATESGRPFFVMELVRGIKITDYCDEHNLTTAQRLALFSSVCLAVQHAHQKGIIHRDLKPSNILVMVNDGIPVPKVIDFGIAKATQGRLTDRTLFTAFEQFIGTPAYMSPEQAELTGIDVDTRSDIYSLGILLYELLTGRPPFDPKSLVQAGLDEIRRIIREVEPQRPSTNLSTLNETDRATIAKLRGTDPVHLSLLLSGDLDWIVMRCLEKDRTRRYETPAALAADIARHLQDEPVLARPPSQAYRLRKAIRRHRLGFAAAAAVTLALMLGTLISTWQAVRAARAERQASQERAQAEGLLAFMLGDLRTQLAKVGRLDVLEGVGEKALAYFAARPAGDLDDPALARLAQALTQIGQLRMDQARYPEAEAAFAEAERRAAALAARHPRDGDLLFERGQAEYWNGFVHWKRGELPTAAGWMTRYHDTCAALVALDPARLEWQNELASSQHNLAVLHQERGEFDPAREGYLAELATLEKLSALSPADLELSFAVADAHSWLGGLAEQQGDLAGALNQYVTQTALVEKLVQREPGKARWRFKLAGAHLLQADVLLATGQLTATAERLNAARLLFDGLVALDPSNRSWLAGSLQSRVREAMLARRQGDAPAATRLVGEVRPQLEQLSAAAPSDRKFILWLATACRLDAQLRTATNRPEAAAAVVHAVELGEKLIQEGRATDADRGECAQALVLAGEFAARAGDRATAQRHWQRALELLNPRLAGIRNWRLLDPAARAAAGLGRADEAQALVAQLTLLGYVPLDPWPAAVRPDAARNSVPLQQQPK